MSGLNFGNKWLMASSQTRPRLVDVGEGEGADRQRPMSSLPLTAAWWPWTSHSLTCRCPDSPTWLQMPGFICEGEESWGCGEKSSLLEGMQELFCESRVLQEAWGPCRPVGCRPGPEDDTSLLRRETNICRSPVKENGEESGGWWSLRTSLRKIPNEHVKGFEHSPRQEAGVEGC